MRRFATNLNLDGRSPIRVLDPCSVRSRSRHMTSCVVHKTVNFCFHDLVTFNVTSLIKMFTPPWLAANPTVWCSCNFCAGSLSPDPTTTSYNQTPFNRCIRISSRHTDQANGILTDPASVQERKMRELEPSHACTRQQQRLKPIRSINITINPLCTTVVQTTRGNKRRGIQNARPSRPKWTFCFLFLSRCFVGVALSTGFTLVPPAPRLSEIVLCMFDFELISYALVTGRIPRTRLDVIYSGDTWDEDFGLGWAVLERSWFRCDE